MAHVIDTGTARRHRHCIPISRRDKWKVIENLGFGSVLWDAKKVILDRRHYEKHFLDLPKKKRRNFITGPELRACYGTEKEERFLGGAFYRFFHEHQDILQSVCEPWFIPAKREGHSPFLLFLGTKYEERKNTESRIRFHEDVYWIFLHKRPDGRLIMGHSSVKGYWPVCCPVLRFAS